jgi:hypothetical protein
MDESGDPGQRSAVPTYTVGTVLVPAHRWVDEFERLIAFRRYLRREFGLKLRTEVKGRQLAQGIGPWVDLALPKRIRSRIYRSFMRFQDRGHAIKTYAVVIDKADPRCTDTGMIRETAWRYTLQRIETFARHNNETMLLVPDSGQYFWFRGLARQMRRFSFVGSLYGAGPLRRDLLRILIDDPVERDSDQSYFIQLADLNAYAAYRGRRPDPDFPAVMWEQLGEAVLWQANRYAPAGSTSGIVDGP